MDKNPTLMTSNCEMHYPSNSVITTTDEAALTRSGIENPNHYKFTTLI
jgi:hypothetical protein